MDGQEPRGQAWIEALKECGVEVGNDGKPRPRFCRRWPEWESEERATTPIALACNYDDPAEQMKSFIESEVGAGHSPEGPYIRKLVASVAELERRIAR